MLIINILSDNNPKFKGRFFKKQLRPDPFYRSSIKIRNRVCTIIEFDESVLPTLDLHRLFSAFRGNIIGSRSVIEQLVPVEYRFDYKPYFKRALLSSLIKTLDGESNNLTLTIKDKNFRLTNEYKEISKRSKSLTIISKSNGDTDSFCNFCFVEYGLMIKISENEDNLHNDIYIDLDDMNEDGKIIIKKKGTDMLLYPDPQYFMIKEELRPLIKYNISPKLLCAAFETQV